MIVKQDQLRLNDDGIVLDTTRSNKVIDASSPLTIDSNTIKVRPATQTSTENTADVTGDRITGVNAITSPNNDLVIDSADAVDIIKNTDGSGADTITFDTGQNGLTAQKDAIKLADGTNVNAFVTTIGNGSSKSPVASAYPPFVSRKIKENFQDLNYTNLEDLSAVYSTAQVTTHEIAITNGSNIQINDYYIPDQQELSFSSGGTLAAQQAEHALSIDNGNTVTLTDNYEKDTTIPDNQDLGSTRAGDDVTITIDNGGSATWFDDYSQYTDGDGLLLSSGDFAVDSPSCNDDEVLTWSSGSFACEEKQTYTGGQGVSYSGSTVSSSGGTGITATSSGHEFSLANTQCPGGEYLQGVTSGGGLSCANSCGDSCGAQETCDGGGYCCQDEDNDNTCDYCQDSYCSSDEDKFSCKYDCKGTYCYDSDSDSYGETSQYSTYPGSNWYLEDSSNITECTTDCDDSNDELNPSSAYYTGDLAADTTVDCERCINDGTKEVTTLKGNGYWSGSSPASDTSGTCYYGDMSCTASGKSNGASTTLIGNGNVQGSGTTRTCYYGDITCGDGSYGDGATSPVDGWGWDDGDLTDDTQEECKPGSATCNDGSASDASSVTLLGNGYLDDADDRCYDGAPTCQSGTAQDGSFKSCPDSEASNNQCKHNEYCSSANGCEYSDSDPCTGESCGADGTADSGTCVWNEQCTASGRSAQTASCINNNCDADGVVQGGRCYYNEACTTTGREIEDDGCIGNNCNADGVIQGGTCYYDESCTTTGQSVSSTSVPSTPYCDGDTKVSSVSCTTTGLSQDSTTDCSSQSYCDTDGDKNEYCKNGDVYANYDYYNKGCSSGSCTTTNVNENSCGEEKVKSCSNGCTDGSCDTACSLSTQTCSATTDEITAVDDSACPGTPDTFSCGEICRRATVCSGNSEPECSGATTVTYDGGSEKSRSVSSSCQGDPTYDVTCECVLNNDETYKAESYSGGSSSTTGSTDGSTDTTGSSTGSSTTGTFTSGGTCFVEDTHVHMADGTLEDIEDVQPGDRVLSYDETKQTMSTSTVGENLVHTENNTAVWKDTYTVVETQSGTTMNVTENHPVAVPVNYSEEQPDPYDRVGELSVGDRIRVQSENGSVVSESITSMKQYSLESEYVYNLDMRSGPDNYFVEGGVLVHNGQHNPYYADSDINFATEIKQESQ